MKDQHIQQERPSHKYFTMLPNLYDDFELDPFEFRLLAHYCRVGECWEGTRTTASNCNMSTGTVVSRRRTLASKGLIRLSESEHDTILITVVDMWKENTAKYGGPSEGVHHMNASVSPDERDRSHGDTEEDLLNKTTKEKGRGAQFFEVVKVWETSVGPITGGIAEELGSMVNEAEAHRSKLPAGAKGQDVSGEYWIIAGIITARQSASGRFNVRYVQAIVDRWMREGFEAKLDREKALDYRAGAGEDFWND